MKIDDLIDYAFKLRPLYVSLTNSLEVLFIIHIIEVCQQTGALIATDIPIQMVNVNALSVAMVTRLLNSYQFQKQNLL